MWYRPITVNAEGTALKSTMIIARRSTDQRAVSGVAKGEWHLTFQIAGYVPVGAKVTLPAELSRIAPISITLKKVSKG